MRFTRDGFLTFLFKQADKAGFGYANGPNFEAIPGLEDAAADFMQEIVDDLLGDQPEQSAHCCTALDLGQREAAGRLGISCGDGQCARRLLGGDQ